MALAKVALDGKFVRLEPLEEHHREAVRPAAQHPEIFSVTTSALGPLYDPYIDNALRRSDGTHDRAFAVLLKPPNHYVRMTGSLHTEEAHKKHGEGEVVRAVAAPERIVDIGVVERAQRRGRDAEDLGMLRGRPDGFAMALFQ